MVYQFPKMPERITITHLYPANPENDSLAEHVFYVEPTSATVIAALPEVFRLASPGDTIVVPLTGSGLKGVKSA